MLATSAPFLAYAAWQWVSGDAAIGAWWCDGLLYRAAAQDWIAGRGFYEPWQLGGPYDIWGQPGAVLYPPPVLLLLVPMSFLPFAVWMLVPLSIVVGVVAWHRPGPEAWPFLAMCLAWPSTMQMIAHANPVLWAWAALALGTVFGWPAVAVLVKPSLVPFALIGLRRRSWWIALGLAFALALPFLPMWGDWIRVTLDGRNTGGLAYSAKEIPMMLIPLIAWASRRPG